MIQFSQLTARKFAQVILDFDPSLRRVQEYLNSVKARPGSDKSLVGCFDPWKQPDLKLL